MSDCCDIHSDVKPATNRVLLYEPGPGTTAIRRLRQCGAAVYNHDAISLRQTDRPDKIEELERTVANPDTIVRSRRIHDAPGPGAEAGADDRSVNR